MFLAISSMLMLRMIMMIDENILVRLMYITK